MSHNPATVVPEEPNKTREDLAEENKQLRRKLVQLESSRLALKLAEAAVKESEERLRAQYEAIPVATYTWAKKGNTFVLMDMNRTGRAESGDNPDQFLNRLASEIFHDRPDIVADLRQCYETRQVVRRETEYLTRGTGARYCGIFTYAFIPPNLVMMHSENITERKQAEIALRQSEERFRQLAEYSEQIFWFQGLEPAGYLYVSPAFERIWETPVPQLLEHPEIWKQAIFEEDLPAYEKARGDTIRGRRAHYQAEYRIHRRDGSFRWILDHGVAIRDDGGTIYRLSGIARDITERRTAIESLRKSEMLFRTLADFTYDWEYWRGPDGHFLYVSPSCARITGYTPEEFMSDPDLLDKIIIPDDRLRFKRHRNQRKVEGKGYRIEFRIRDKSGRQRWISQVSQVVKDPDRGYLGVRASNRDLSELSQAVEAAEEQGE